MTTVLVLSSDKFNLVLNTFESVRSPETLRLSETDVCMFIKYMQGKFTINLDDIDAIMKLSKDDLNQVIANEKLIANTMYDLEYCSRPWESPLRRQHIGRMYTAVKQETQNRIVGESDEKRIQDSLDLAVGISDKHFPEWVDGWIESYLNPMPVMSKVDTPVKINKWWEWIKS